MMELEYSAWFYRRCTQKELNYIKKETYNCLKRKCDFWKHVIEGKYYKIAWNQVDCYDIWVNESSFENEQERSERMYKKIYELEYVETVTTVNDILSNHPHYLTIDYNTLSDDEKEKLNIEAMFNTGYNNFLELQEHIKIFNDISFSEFCKIQKTHYEKMLNTLDLSKKKTFTEKDNCSTLLKYYSGSHAYAVTINENNGKLYTLANCPNNIKITEPDTPRFYNPEELIDWVNNWKYENNKRDLLTKEQTNTIRNFFKENNGDALVEFG